jgi:hypothetical protein
MLFYVMSSCFYENGFPQTSRLWSRQENVCSSSDDIPQMHVKSCILQHKHNSSQESKSMKNARAIRTNAYNFASQSSTCISASDNIFINASSASNVPGSNSFLVSNQNIPFYVPRFRRKMTNN